MKMINDTLYAKYIKDREGLEILEDESAFVTYRITGQELYVKDACVEKSKRGSLKYIQVLRNLKEIGIENGCQFITTNIYLSDSSATYNLKVALKAGFRVTAAENGVLLLIQSVHSGGK